jgi:hypothetical protein
MWRANSTVAFTQVICLYGENNLLFSSKKKKKKKKKKTIDY